MQDAKSQVNSLTKYFGKVKNILNIKPKDIKRFKIDMVSADKNNATINRHLANILSGSILLVFKQKREILFT